MSNLITLKNTSSVPARETRRTSRLAEKISTGGTLRRLGTNTNGTFKRIVGGEQIGKAIPHQIDVIIVDMLPDVSREYYASEYDPDNASLPDCWSSDGKVPDAKASNKQASACGKCPMNVDGSANRGKGKACRFKRRLAVLVEGDPTGEIYQLNVASKSLFGKSSGPTYPFESYCKYLKSNGEAPDTLVTRVAYDLDADTLTLNFREVRFLTEEEEAMVDAAFNDPETKRYTTLTPAEVDGVSNKPAGRMAIAPPPPPAAPAPVDEDEEEPAPVARTIKKASAPPPKANDITSVLDEWADEDED